MSSVTIVRYEFETETPSLWVNENSQSIAKEASTGSKDWQAISIDIEAEAHRFFFRPEEQSIVEKIEAWIDPIVHKHMTPDAPCVSKHYGYVHDKGFIGLGFMPPLSRILDHPGFEGWIMKGSPKRTLSLIKNKQGRSKPNNYENILRVFMAERMLKVIEEENLDIIIPEKRLLVSKFPALPNSLHKKYYVFAKKLDLFDIHETEIELEKMSEDQRIKIARDICTLIKKTGFMDANRGNIRLTKDYKIAIIDTESQGLLRDKSDQKRRNKKNSFEKCVLIGLEEFKKCFLLFFSEEIDKAIKPLLKRRKLIKKVICYAEF